MDKNGDLICPDIYNLKIIDEKQLSDNLKENIEKCIIEFKKEFLKDA